VQFGQLALAWVTPPKYCLDSNLTITNLRHLLLRVQLGQQVQVPEARALASPQQCWYYPNRAVAYLFLRLSLVQVPEVLASASPPKYCLDSNPTITNLRHLLLRVQLGQQVQVPEVLAAATPPKCCLDSNPTITNLRHLLLRA
jgi:hypothetical protein